MKAADGILRALGAWLARFRSDVGGNIALVTALAGPAVILLGVGAIDLLAVSSAHGRLQSIADAGALAGAPHLALATDGAGAKERAASFVAGEISQWEGAPAYTGTYEVVEQGGQRAIRVVLRGHRPSFFANMLPPGGWNFVGDATATSVGLVPLCVLITGNDRVRMLHVRNLSRLAAPACMVHSNHDIMVEGGSITGAAVQAVTSARGSISPSPGTGAAPIDDPFANLDLDHERRLDCPVGRVLEPLRLAAGSRRIPAGVHCGGLDISGSATVVLEPGEHWFLGGHLTVRQNARLEGDDVVLFFDTASRFAFTESALVRLSGRTTGAYAGIVMGATRDNRQDFVISSDNVESLLGVVYVPAARMIVEGRADVARDSAWTVIVAHALLMRGSPSLYINADYNASRVPVPAGVGPRTGGSRLVE
ncbi:TadE/TadG family type IV pilus assembly protein [Brevundimonas sp.]|uniref:TadE/TadG family type IV pilus assembly protein n=1 Tax=Brevundimonas sp. TaxID=1871086 RepID=UPI003F6ECD67